jgi:hypothetical protein
MEAALRYSSSISPTLLVRRMLELRLGGITLPATCPGTYNRPLCEMAASSEATGLVEAIEGRRDNRFSLLGISGILARGGTKRVDEEPEAELPGMEASERTDRTEGAGDLLAEERSDGYAVARSKASL